MWTKALCPQSALWLKHILGFTVIILSHDFLTGTLFHVVNCLVVFDLAFHWRKDFFEDVFHQTTCVC